MEILRSGTLPSNSRLSTGAPDPCNAGVLGPETAKAGATKPAVAWRRVH